MLPLLLIGASLASAGCSFIFINRYLSFKLHKNTFPFTLTTLLINMWLLLSITYLLPLDVFSAAANRSNNGNSTIDSTSPSTGIYPRMAQTTPLLRRDTSQSLPNFSLIWYAVYWLEFMVCWFILPVLISYTELKYLFANEPGTSHRKVVWTRIKKAIMTNIKFYALFGIGLGIGLLYLIFGMKRGLSDLKPLIISLSHLYSLSYTLILLSMGLILLPKALLFENNNENRMFVELSKANDESNDAKLSMTDFAEKILTLPPVQNGDVALNQVTTECKLEVQSLVNEIQISIPNLNSAGNGNNLSFEKINKHYNGFKTEYYNYLYYQAHSDSIIHDLARSQSKSFSMSKTIFNYIIGSICMSLSILVALLELTPSKFAHAWIFEGHSWWNFLLEISILVYNTLVSLYAMSCIKFQNFHLIPNGRSNPKNTLYFSLYSSRLLLPLCFNFMALIPRAPKGEQSSFERVLYKDLELIPLVNFLNRFLPMLFVIVVPLSYFFDLKRKVLLKLLGEDYYYEMFGILYDPVPQYDRLSEDQSPAGRTRLDEDYEYSLQDGRYLFQRATSNFGMGENDSSYDTRTYI